MKSPLNIIFDLGGVLLNIDYAKTENAFIRLGFANFSEMYNQFKSNTLFEDLETGKMEPDKFFGEMQKLSPVRVSTGELANAWNAMLLDFRIPSLAYLTQLAKNHRLYLLSNTNAIHHEAFVKIFATLPGQPPSFDNYFTKAWYSHQVGLRKPGREVFDFVIRDAGLDPADTLFIDDSYNNLEGARQAGLQVHLLKPGELVEEILEG